MLRIILTYGVFSGVIIIGTAIFGIALAGESTDMAALEWVGYLVMIVALSMIFVGIKQYRDRELGGIIKFGTAFKLGLGISLVASLIYVGVWEVNLAVTNHAFIEEYTQSVIDQKRAEGVTGAELAAVIEEQEAMKENYAKLYFRLPITFIEIFPVALLITLISAAILRKREVMPAHPA